MISTSCNKKINNCVLRKKNHNQLWNDNILNSKNSMWVRTIMIDSSCYLDHSRYSSSIKYIFHNATFRKFTISF